MTLNSPWYEYVKSGEKTLEGRRYTDAVARIEPGDTLIFCHHTDKTLESISKTVVEVFRFKTFEEGLFEPGILKQALPNVNEIEVGVQIYLKYVSLPTQNRDGVAFIQLK